jgi:hypothetical protein
VQVVNETTLQAARRLIDAGHRPLALNFANGVQPGGGFFSILPTVCSLAEASYTVREPRKRSSAVRVRSTARWLTTRCTHTTGTGPCWTPRTGRSTPLTFRYSARTRGGRWMSRGC